MIEPLKVCKKYYPKIYKLWMEGDNECKAIAYNIYYHNYGYTFNKNIANYCKIRNCSNMGEKIFKRV